MNSRPGRLGIGVVGAGRVGAVLASALRAAGHGVIGASAASEESRERADVLLPGVPVLRVEEVVERSELLLLTVPDDVLPGLVRGLADLGRFVPGQLVVHTAGRFGTEVLTPAREKGAIPLAIHPAMTFTGTSIDLSRLVGAPFAVTAPGPVLPIAQALVVEVGGEPVPLDEGARGMYHAALAHGANHLVTITAQARRILASVQVEDPGTLLRPLLTAALDGALRIGDGALTGPVSRGDASTVAEHVQMLAAFEAERDVLDVLPSYLALARATVQRSLATGRIRDDQARAILDELNRVRRGLPVSADRGPAAQPVGQGPAAQEADAGSGLPAADAGSAAQAADAAATTTPVAAAGAEAATAAEDSQDGGVPQVLHTIGEVRTHLAQLPTTRRRAVVMTMGALHAGHLSLIHRARELADHVTVTIFVNPLQFDQEADLAAYPRTLDDDLQALVEVGGVDVVFAPSAEEMYPSGAPQVQVQGGGLAGELEGAARPGHFDGMLTVVHKLLSITAPDVAIFGQKDAQQLVLVRHLVRDLNLGTQVVAAPTVREPDGLALSSRNTRLGPEQREQALTLVRALRAGAAAAQQGQDAAGVLHRAREVFDVADGEVLDLDYLELLEPETMQPYRAGNGTPGLLVVAAQVGPVRLIDNMEINWG